jgi:RNA polymerase sigma factor (sigma-70 family)
MDKGFQKWSSIMESPKPPQKGRKTITRPWQNPDGSEIQTDKLREIAKSWDHLTWEAYLKWYQSPLREKHVHPYRYDIKLEELRESMFSELDQSTKQTKVNLCERLLSNLPEHQQKVLNLHFFSGLPDVEIGPRIGRSRSRVQRQRIQALDSLKRGISGDKRAKCQFMRKEIVFLTRFWDQKMTFSLKENRSYRSEEQAAAFDAIAPIELQGSILSLSPRAQKAIFLRFWCEYTFGEIGRELDMGHNTISMVLDSSVSKLKRNLINTQLNYFPGDRSPYGAE